MSNKIQISASIVLYKENLQTLQLTVKSFLQTPFSKKVYLIDNSPTDALKKHFIHPEIEYIFNNKNIGFGKAHNLIISKLNSDFHLVLNPDVSFDLDVLPKLIYELEKQKKVSMISPKATYPSGKLQFTCRKNPKKLELLYRRLGVKKNFIQQQEYRDIDLSKSFFPDFIHGFFMLFKTADFIKLKGFDERYFLYMEDADICREIKKSGKEILYYPKVQITHVHRRGSKKNIQLLRHHFFSAIKYFKKWKN